MVSAEPNQAELSSARSLNLLNYYQGKSFHDELVARCCDSRRQKQTDICFADSI